MDNFHEPVLIKEVIKYLNIKKGGVYVDGTFGRGGHSREILRELGDKGFLLAIDKDPQAVAFARSNFGQSEHFEIRQGSFNMLYQLANEFDIIHKIDGILIDLGVSSPQLDEAERGFSFLHDGPLDMRMDPNQKLDAATFINTAEEQEIARVLAEYGEERFARRIAGGIVKARIEAPILRTKKLAEIVAAANPAWEPHKHPATRSFQAIRIHINQELTELETFLTQALSVLAVGGRLAVISFHSLEDRRVKAFIQKNERGDDFPRDLPIPQAMLQPKLKRIVWGLHADNEEIQRNPRSRSAILRIAEKTS